MNSSDTILVVIDNESEGSFALTRAHEMAGFFGCRIELFSAVFDPYIAGERFTDSDDLIESKTRRLQEERDRLEVLAIPLREKGVEVSVDVAWDEPVYEGIVRQVLRSKPRMVIRNNQYHATIMRGLISNDDWNLIRTCPAPLLIARAPSHQHKKLRICAAVDPMHTNDKPADLDQRILDEARALATLSGGELSILHAYDVAPVIGAMGAGTMTPIIPDVSSIKNSVHEAHQQALDKLLDSQEIDRGAAHHLPGSPRNIIPAYATEKEIDLLVMGAVSRGFFGRHFIGSTAERILDRLPCDLLIVKPSDFKTKVRHESRHRFQPDTDVTDAA